MSCAAGVTDGKIITLGADSAASGTGDEIYTLENLQKVFARDAYLFGYCGSARIGQILRYQVELPEPPASGYLEPFLVREFVPEIRRAVEAAGAAGEGYRVLGDKTAILIGCRAELWCVASDLTVVREDPFAAIGSGRLRAYGALHALNASGGEPPRRQVEIALEAAAAFTNNVRPPFHFVTSGDPPSR